MLPVRRRLGRKRWPRCVTLGHEPLNREDGKTQSSSNNCQKEKQSGNADKHGAKLWTPADRLDKYPAYLPIPGVKRSRGIEMARGSLCKAIMEMFADNIQPPCIASELIQTMSKEDSYHDDPYHVNEVEVRHSPTELILRLSHSNQANVLARDILLADADSQTIILACQRLGLDHSSPLESDFESEMQIEGWWIMSECEKEQQRRPISRSIWATGSNGLDTAPRFWEKYENSQNRDWRMSLSPDIGRTTFEGKGRR